MRHGGPQGTRTSDDSVSAAYQAFPVSGLAKPVSTAQRTGTMPQTTASDVQAPASAAQTPAPSGVVGAPLAITAPQAPISPEQAAFLRARRDALSNQLESVQGRRDDVAEKLRSDETQAIEKPGLQDRLRVLDDRLIQIEREISANSEQLANAPPRQEQFTGAPSSRGGGLRGVNTNMLTVFTFLLLIPFAIQMARRFFAPPRGPSRSELVELASMRERLDKLDGAVDAVALEVERIGEGQRFLTQAMTENLQRGQSALGARVPAFEPAVARARDAIEQR